MNEVRILPYNRVVRDLNGLSEDEFLKCLDQIFSVQKIKTDQIARRQFGLLLGKNWYTLKLKPEFEPKEDPVLSLDVSILQNLVLDPLLGIKDVRRDKRIDFIGGIRGDQGLIDRVNSGWAVAFSLHPTSIEDLVRIADANEVMPPKSTWFEPKLRDGLCIHLI